MWTCVDPAYPRCLVSMDRMYISVQRGKMNVLQILMTATHWQVSDETLSQKMQKIIANEINRGYLLF